MNRFVYMQEGVSDYVLVNHYLLMEYMLVFMCFMEASNQLIFIPYTGNTIL